jgi:hypothetical protein
MTNEEAQQLKQGDEVNVGGLIVKVIGLRADGDDLFVCTDYGDFNASVCEKGDGNG